MSAQKNTHPKQGSSVFSPVMKTVTATVSMGWFAWGFTDPYWALYINEIVGNNYFLAGVLAAVFQFFTILSVLLVGNIVDKVGGLRCLFWNRWGYFFVGPLYCLAGFTKSILFLMLAFIVNAASKGFRDIGEQTFLMKHATAKTCSRVLGVNHAVKHSFWILGVLSGAVIFYFLEGKFSSLNIISSMYLILSVFVALGILLLWKHREDFEPKIKGVGKTIRNVFVRDKLVLPLWRDFRSLNLPLRFSLCLFSFLDVLGQSISFFIPLLARELGFSFSQIGILIAIVWAPFLFLFLFAYIADRCDRLTMLQYGFSFTGFPLILIAFTQDPILLGVFSSLLALSYGMLEPALFGIVGSLAPPAKRGEIASLQFFFTRTGSIAALFLLGFIAEYFGIQISFFVLAAITATIVLLTIWLRHSLIRQKIIHRHMMRKKHKIHHHHHIYAHVHRHNAHRH